MKSLGVYKPSEAKKEHYKKVGVWLKSNPQISYKKLAIGYQIDISTVPVELSEEFIQNITFKE